MPNCSPGVGSSLPDHLPPSQKSEDNLGLAESELDKQNNAVAEMTRKVEIFHLDTGFPIKLFVIGGGTTSQSERGYSPEGQVRRVSRTHSITIVEFAGFNRVT